MASRKTNKVIAHFLDGTLIKGTTPDFYPSRAKFHLTDSNGEVHKIDVGELKALFFVKDFKGRPDYRERKGFFGEEEGSKVMVEFFDGEIIFGHTITYSTKGHGFFLIPGDPDSNNDKVYVVHSSTKRVKVKPSEESLEEDGGAPQTGRDGKPSKSKKGASKTRKKRRTVKA